MFKKYGCLVCKFKEYLFAPFSTIEFIKFPPQKSINP